MIKLQLLKKTLPTIKLYRGVLECSCLLDTGANICVWTKGMELFEEMFPARKVLKDKFTLLTGFGGPGYKVPVCNVSSIEFSAGDEILVLRDVDVAVLDSTVLGPEFVLAMCTLRNNRYTVDMSNGVFIVEGDTSRIQCKNIYTDVRGLTCTVALSQEEHILKVNEDFDEWSTLSKEEMLDDAYKEIKFNRKVARVILPTLAYKTRESLIENINKYYSRLEERG